MKTLKQCQQHRSSVYIFNCEHIPNFLLIVDFEQTKVCWVHIEKINTFEDKIRYIMCYVAVISVWPKLLTNSIWSYKPTGESVRNFCEVVYFRLWFWLKRCGWHSKLFATHWSFYQLLFYRFCLLED